MPRTAPSSFRVGKVQVYLRGRIWYLCYHENGRRRRPRVGPDGNAARRLAAQTNAQLESGDVTVLGFEPLPIPDLRQRWLDHHEHVLRSSINTINRYRTATDHLLNFVRDVHPVRVASNFSARDAEAFVRHLRTIEVAPNGHANSKKRRLLDKGVTFIAECCRALFVYAAKRRQQHAR
jgi:integrase